MFLSLLANFFICQFYTNDQEYGSIPYIITSVFFPPAFWHSSLEKPLIEPTEISASAALTPYILQWTFSYSSGGINILFARHGK